jgi:hypothetical protein
MVSSMTTPSCSELANVLEDHIRRIRLIQKRLDRLEGMKIEGGLSESLYQSIMAEVERRTGQFNGGVDVLMCLVDECLAMIEKANDDELAPSIGEEGVFEDTVGYADPVMGEGVIKPQLCPA